MQSSIPAIPAKECLGLVLGGREIGYAVSSKGRLRHYGVLNIRKLNSQESKEARFRQVVKALFDRFNVTSVVVVEPVSGFNVSPLFHSLAIWLRDELLRRRVQLVTTARETVRQRHAEDKRPATQRALARTLAVRFPELERLTLPAEAESNGCVRPTSKERYWSSMFLALAAALKHLEQPDPARSRIPRRYAS